MGYVDGGSRLKRGKVKSGYWVVVVRNEYYIKNTFTNIFILEVNVFYSIVCWIVNYF